MAYNFLDRRDALLRELDYMINDWDDGYNDDAADFLKTVYNLVDRAVYGDREYQRLRDFALDNKEDLRRLTGGSYVYNEIMLLDTQTTMY
jgi:hypothetical protein